MRRHFRLVARSAGYVQMYGRNQVALGDQWASVGNAIVESSEVGPRVGSWNHVGGERPSNQCSCGRCSRSRKLPRRRRAALLLSSTTWIGWTFERWAPRRVETRLHGKTVLELSALTVKRKSSAWSRRRGM